MMLDVRTDVLLRVTHGCKAVSDVDAAYRHNVALHQWAHALIRSDAGYDVEAAKRLVE
jgi:hypothetical protein